MKRFDLKTKLMMTIALGAVGTPALACERTATLYGGVWDGYTMQDLGIPATGNTVFQGGGTVSCGPWYGDVWVSYDLQASGSFGERGFGDEIDFTGGYKSVIDTPIGHIAYDASIAYWALASFSEGNDDMVALRLDLARPIELGTVTMTPALEFTQWVGLGVYDNALITTPRVTFDVPFSERWSVSLELADSFGGVSGEDVWHANAAVNYTNEDFAGWFGVRVTENLDPFDDEPVVIAGFGGSINFDF